MSNYKAILPRLKKKLEFNCERMIFDSWREESVLKKKLEFDLIYFQVPMAEGPEAIPSGSQPSSALKWQDDNLERTQVQDFSQFLFSISVDFMRIRFSSTREFRFQATFPFFGCL